MEASRGHALSVGGCGLRQPAPRLLGVLGLAPSRLLRKVLRPDVQHRHVVPIAVGPALAAHSIPSTAGAGALSRHGQVASRATPVCDAAPSLAGDARRLSGSLHSRTRTALGLLLSRILGRNSGQRQSPRSPLPHPWSRAGPRPPAHRIRHGAALLHPEALTARHGARHQRGDIEASLGGPHLLPRRPGAGVP